MYLLDNKDIITYTSNFNYATNFFGDSLFSKQKTANFQVAMRKLAKNGNLPVMARFHALDTEARIGDRTNYREINVEKLLIKEKLNQTESIERMLQGASADKRQILDFIYDDMGNLLSRVLTRVELANMQLLSTGQIKIDENDYKYTVDFGFDSSSNKLDVTGWNDPTHDILGDIETIKKKAKANGNRVITMAITSDKVLNYLFINNAIKGYFEKGVSTELYTTDWVVRWLERQTGILFATNEDVYKLNANDTATHRFYPENSISWLTIPRNTAFGVDLYGMTPEELKLKEISTSLINQGLLTITQWETPDPVATWTKASGIVIPIPQDIDNLFLTKVTETDLDSGE